MAPDRKEEYTEIFTELETIARVQSVKSSNAIEGIVTIDERINEIMNGINTSLNHTRDSNEKTVEQGNSGGILSWADEGETGG